MIRNKPFLMLFVLLLTVMVVLAMSCITIVEKPAPGSKPSTPPSTPPSSPPLATPPSAPPAQPAPAPAPAAAARPDLVVTDIRIIGREVYYTVKNIGAAESRGSRAYFYVNGIKEADDYTEPLAPGQERPGPFGNYTWKYQLVETVPDSQYRPGGTLADEDTVRRFTLKVCADVENTLVEANEANNCKVIIHGVKFAYSFVSFAHQALWSTGYGVLKLPLPEESATGAALVTSANLEDNQGYGSVLLTIPQQVGNGWIQGRFGQFFTDQFRQTQVKEFTVPDLARFSAKVGFTSSSAPGSKARFLFGVVDPGGVVTWANPAITASMDGKLETYDVDLSGVAGQKRQFVLRVEVIGPAQNVKPVWADPRIYQP